MQLLSPPLSLCFFLVSDFFGSGSGSFGGQDGILVPRRSAGYGSQRIVHWGIQDRRSSMYTNDREIANEIL